MSSDRPHKFTAPTLKDGNRWRGLRIGLFGGSFNPPHAGHVHVAQLAKVKFGLDFVWWLVTPQNPLKESKHTKPYKDRYKNVESMLENLPKHLPTHLETQIKSQYTYETVSTIRNVFPQTEFLWICGMDNAYIFHKWERWQDIIQTMPVAFIARPPATDLVKSCPLRMTKNIVTHKYETRGAKTDLNNPAIYWLAGNKMLDISSTNIRKNIAKPNG